MADPRPVPDDRPAEGGDDVKRQIKKRIAIAGALVAVALAAIPLLNSLNDKPVETTASNPQSSSGRIIAASEPLSAAAPPEASAPSAEASAPAQAAPGLPAAPATENTPSVAATQATPPTTATAPATRAPATTTAQNTTPSTPVTPMPAAPTRQAQAPVQTVAPVTTPTPAPAPAPLVPRAIPKAQPPAQAQTVEPARSGSFGYNVQLGLFGSLDNALKLANALKAQGIPVKTETRVQVGPFRTRAEAEETMAKLKSLGYNPLLQAATQ